MNDSRAPSPEDFALTRQESAPERRDELGFVTSEQPNLSARQVRFILARAATHDNVEAADMAGVELAEVVEWFGQPEFNQIYLTFLQNKREGVKQIGQQITPVLLLRLTQILETGNNKEVIAAAKLIANMQGMLITQNAPVDKGLLEEIRQELMKPRPIIRDVT